MVKRLYLFICLICFNSLSWAGVVTGTVKDADTGEELVGANYIPQAGSPVLSGASFTDTLLTSWFEKVTYVGAFSTNDNWLRGWTEFDPQNANY